MPSVVVGSSTKVVCRMPMGSLVCVILMVSSISAEKSLVSRSSYTLWGDNTTHLR